MGPIVLPFIFSALLVIYVGLIIAQHLISIVFQTQQLFVFFLFCKLIVFLVNSDDGSEIDCVRAEKDITSLKNALSAFPDQGTLLQLEENYKPSPLPF